MGDRIWWGRPPPIPPTPGLFLPLFQPLFAQECLPTLPCYLALTFSPLEAGAPAVPAPPEGASLQTPLTCCRASSRAAMDWATHDHSSSYRGWDAVASLCYVSGLWDTFPWWAGVTVSVLLIPRNRQSMSPQVWLLIGPMTSPDLHSDSPGCHRRRGREDMKICSLAVEFMIVHPFHG